jgi:hypothetical protein
MLSQTPVEEVDVFPSITQDEVRTIDTGKSGNMVDETESTVNEPSGGHDSNGH